MRVCDTQSKNIGCNCVAVGGREKKWAKLMLFTSDPLAHSSGIKSCLRLHQVLQKYVLGVTKSVTPKKTIKNTGHEKVGL